MLPHFPGKAAVQLRDASAGSRTLSSKISTTSGMPAEAEPILTQTFWQQTANKFTVVSHMKDAVHAGSHQLLLRVSKVTRHVLGNKNNAALSVDNKEKSIQGLYGGRLVFKSA